MSTKVKKDREVSKYSAELKYQYGRIALFALRRISKKLCTGCVECSFTDEQLEEFATDVGAEVYERVWVKKNGAGGISLRLPAPIQTQLGK